MSKVIVYDDGSGQRVITPTIEALVDSDIEDIAASVVPGNVIYSIVDAGAVPKDIETSRKEKIAAIHKEYVLRCAYNNGDPEDGEITVAYTTIGGLGPFEYQSAALYQGFLQIKISMFGLVDENEWPTLMRDVVNDNHAAVKEDYKNIAKDMWMQAKALLERKQDLVSEAQNKNEYENDTISQEDLDAPLVW